MNILITISCILSIAILSSCDLRSETAKKGLERYVSSPTPPILPLPTPTTVDPRESVIVDTNQEGETIQVNGFKEKKRERCDAFNRMLINGDDNEIKIGGICRQIMINGDRNKISIEGASEFIFNGSENILIYLRFVNGKLPSLVENRPGNIVEKRRD